MRKEKTVSTCGKGEKMPRKNIGIRLFSIVFLLSILAASVFPATHPVSTAARGIIRSSAPRSETAMQRAPARPTGLLTAITPVHSKTPGLVKETAVQHSLDKLLSNSAKADTRSQSQDQPRYSGNGLVVADAGSGGKLLRTPANRYFTILNYTAGWRVKNFTVAHEGGKPLDYVREIGHFAFPPGAFCWYSTFNNNCVGEKEGSFYKVAFKQPGPVQLGLAVQIWPGYADDPARLFYISQVELVNIKTEDTCTVELNRDLPLENERSSSDRGGLSRDHQEKNAGSRADLQQALARALKQRTSLLKISYSGGPLKMPDAVEAMLEEALAQDDYLRYSLSGYNIRWADETGKDLDIEFNFQYLATKKEEDYVERQTTGILQKILNPGMNEHQKVKTIHDYIVANVAYDLDRKEHSAYAALAKGRAVCQGYALLLHKMLNKTGIKTRIISGQAGGEKHVWNLVNLNNNWYHIDATWNDPVPDIPNRVNHNFYLRTDEQMSATHTWNRTLYPAARAPYPRAAFEQ